MMRKSYLKLLERSEPAPERAKPARRNQRVKPGPAEDTPGSAVSGTHWGYRYCVPDKTFSGSEPYRLISLEVHEHGRMAWVRSVIQVQGQERTGEALGSCPVLAGVESLQLAARIRLTSFELYLASPEELGDDSGESKITVWLQKKKRIAHEQARHLHAPVAGGVAFVKALNQLTELLP